MKNQFGSILLKLLPIGFGSLSYLLFREEPVFGLKFFQSSGLQGLLQGDSVIQLFCANHLPDILFVMSFAYFFLSIWKNFWTYAKFFFGLISIMSFELIQLVLPEAGTFDILDLILMSITFILTSFLARLSSSRGKPRSSDLNVQ